MDIQDMLRTHVEASLRVKELQAECSRLRNVGKVKEARLVLAQIEEIEARMRALERELRRGRAD